MIKILRHNINSLQKLVEELPLDHVVYKEGSDVGQIAFHASQSTNNFIRVHVLRLPFNREKEKEYGEKHDLAEIIKSIEMVREGCDLLDEKNPDLSEKLANPIEMKSSGFTLETNLDALAFGLSHLAEHVGELNQVKRKIIV